MEEEEAVKEKQQPQEKGQSDTEPVGNKRASNMDPEASPSGLPSNVETSTR